MNIQAEKLHLIEWISRLNDKTLIERLMGIKDDYVKSKDWWAELTKEELESINKGLKDLDAGRTHSHSEAKDIYGKYL